MRRTLRLLTLVGAAAASLALAGNALAKTPQLIIGGSPSTAASAETVVEVKEAKEDAAPSRITIYVPVGYTANITQATGTQIGTVTASLQALQISPDAIIDVPGGTVLVGDKSSTALMTSATGCTGTATHAAIWLLHVSVSGQVLDVPVYVDPTTGAEAAVGSAKLVLCLGNPYEQAPAGTRAPFGVKVLDAKMTLAAGTITNPPAAGSYVWRSVITPWTVNGATPNPLGTLETQAIVNLPIRASLAGKVKTVRHRKKVGGQTRITVTNSVLLSGKLVEGLQGVAGAKVTFLANGKSVGSTTTSATGTFSKTAGLKKKTSFTVRVLVPARETACVSPLPVTSVPAGCVTATLAGYTIESSAVTATPKKR